MGDLALTNIAVGDKAAAFAFVEKGMAAVPIEKDALDGPAVQLRFLLASPCRWESPTVL